MPSIVQFTHPGGEHGPDSASRNYKSWNTGLHKRKFLECEGSYINRGYLKHGLLRFWGEWEPPSEVQELSRNPEPGHPRWLHKPVMPVEIPISDGRTYQNTDPFVFGDRFRYFVCKQYIRKTGRVTQMARLDRGSVILFGSTKGRSRAESTFLLDTVFVVSDYIDYDPANGKLLLECDERIPDYYKDIVYRIAFPQKTNVSLPMRCYLGATFDSPFQGMYSYVPSQSEREGISTGFPRVQLKDMLILTNNLNSKPKRTVLGIEEIAEYWSSILRFTQEQKCLPGVSINMKY